MLYSLQNISDIHEWAKTESVREFLNSEFNIYKLPSRAQFYNLIGCVDPKKFGALFIEWVEEIVQENDLDRTIAIDGKSICSTSQRTENVQQMHILSAIVSEIKLILGSLPCKTKISEPAVFRELINILDISGAIVVADALRCKKESARKVVEEKGDYLFVVKDNNPTLREDIKCFIKKIRR